MAKHEFGIIDAISDDMHIYEQYTPEKYHCIAVSDTLLDPFLPLMDGIPTFFHNTSQPGFGLDAAGITLIPPSSAPQFAALLQGHCPELDATAAVFRKAFETRRFVIHYGL